MYHRSFTASLNLGYRVRITLHRRGGCGRNGRYPRYSRQPISRCCYRGSDFSIHGVGGNTGRHSARCIRSAGPIRQEINSADILVLSICHEVRLDGAVTAGVAESVSDAVDNSVDGLLVVPEEFLEGGAEVGGVGVSGGVAGLVSDAACKDLSFEAVEAVGDALEVGESGKGGGDGLLAVD